MRITRIGGPTMYVELDGWGILVDPTFDPPGRRYPFALGTPSVKTRGPALRIDQLGPIDVVLVSHDHHADNLDDAGRGILAKARHVITTAAGATRLNLPTACGLEAGQTLCVEDPDKPPLTVTATPCRHGPPFSRLVVGDVIGFALQTPPEQITRLWVTGDTVLYPPLVHRARVLEVDVAIINTGGVRFGITGPLRYTMTGADAVKLIAELKPRVAIPAHYDGWSHFRDGEEGLRAALEHAPSPIKNLVTWLPDGQPTEV